MTKNKPRLTVVWIGLLIVAALLLWSPRAERPLADNAPGIVERVEGRLYLPLIRNLPKSLPTIPVRPTPTFPAIPTFPPPSTATPQPLGITERVSVGSLGIQGDGQSYAPSLSADGRYVAFVSDATNLVASDTNGQSDVFCYDRQTGQTTRMSLSSSGEQASGHSYWSAISGSGRYVAFESGASNLVGDDTNDAWDVFMRDRDAGETMRINVDSSGGQVSGGASRPAISADGRYVAFESMSLDLVAGDTNNDADVFVRDRHAGVTTRVSVDSSGAQGNGASAKPAISADGRHVVFQSSASNLVPGDTNDSDDVFCHDRQTGDTARISVDSSSNQANGGSYAPSISADGRYVAFFSEASNLVQGDTNGVADVFVHDLVTGETSRASTSSGHIQGNGPSNRPCISGDGRYVAFWSAASTLVSGDTNGFADVFVHDRQTGDTTLVSLGLGGFPAAGGTYGSSWPAISADGRYVAFVSDANNLVPGDTNGFRDIFVYDRLSVD